MARRGLVAAIVAGLAWTCWNAIDVWPDALCYTNELWGDTTQGYRYVSEANYDWGQGLKELDGWRGHQGLAALDVWYFGTDPRLSRLPLHALPLHSLPLESADNVVEEVRGRHLAVSTTMLYGFPPTTPGYRQSREFLRNCRPVGRTTTFLIYDFTPGPDGRPISLPEGFEWNNAASR